MFGHWIIVPVDDVQRHRALLEDVSFSLLYANADYE